MNGSYHAGAEEIVSNEKKIIDLTNGYSEQRKIEIRTRLFYSPGFFNSEDELFFRRSNSVFTFTSLTPMGYSSLFLEVSSISYEGHYCWEANLEGEQGPLIKRISQKRFGMCNEVIINGYPEFNNLGLNKFREAESRIIDYFSRDNPITESFLGFL